MNCPECDYPQYCPCDSCKGRLPEDKKPWIWVNGELVQCANCGFTAHADWWEDRELKNYKHNESLFNQD